MPSKHEAGRRLLYVLGKQNWLEENRVLARSDAVSSVIGEMAQTKHHFVGRSASKPGAIETRCRREPIFNQNLLVQAMGFPHSFNFVDFGCTS